MSGNYSVQKIVKVNFPGKKKHLNLCNFRFLTHILDSLGAKVKERLRKADRTSNEAAEKNQEKDEEDEDDEDDEDNNDKEKTKKKTKKVKRLYTKSEDKKVFYIVNFKTKNILKFFNNNSSIILSLLK